MNNIDINCDADVTAVCAPVSPCVARYSPESGKHKPFKAKSRLGRFSPGFAETDRRYENKQVKAEGLRRFPSAIPADGNADRIRLCGAFEGGNKNCDLGVARTKTSQV